MGNDTGYNPQINLGHQTSALNWAGYFCRCRAAFVRSPKMTSCNKTVIFHPFPKINGNFRILKCRYCTI